jgi:hypothetical protein
MPDKVETSVIICGHRKLIQCNKVVSNKNQYKTMERYENPNLMIVFFYVSNISKLLLADKIVIGQT